MEWERSDVQAAKALKDLVERHTLKEIRGADIVPAALALQWLRRLTEYLEAEVAKPKEVKRESVKRRKCNDR